LHLGCRRDEFVAVEERPTDSDEWVDVVVTYHTPEGDLRTIARRSTVGKPGYDMEYLLKDPGDIKKLLSIPYEPFPFLPERHIESDTAVGDRGIAVFGLDHAMYGLQRVIGSENFAMWRIECDDLMMEAMTVFATRIRKHVMRALETGLRPVFGWVGPELCIPPLMSFDDFDRYVFALDKPLCDLIHDGGGYVWVHSHGRMGGLLERFVEMGVDVLNPIEPPPMGDVTLEDAFDVVGSRMGLEGNIEAGDLMIGDEDDVREMIHDALMAGRGRRFILCPTSGYMEDPTPPETLINNLLLFIHEGVRFAEACGAG
jgi:hypothetical protein